MVYSAVLIQFSKLSTQHNNFLPHTYHKVSMSEETSTPNLGGSLDDHFKSVRERSRKRKILLAQQFGVDSLEKLHSVLGVRSAAPPNLEVTSYLTKRTHLTSLKRTASPASVSSVQERERSKKDTENGKSSDPLPEPNEEGGPLVYKDSSTFLKGTQSSNPHNDYCQHFVDTGQRPQNFIRDVGLGDRFEEYPKLKELIRLKDELIQETASPPMYLKTDLHTFPLSSVKTKFDVILIEPPLEEYQRSYGITGDVEFWNWDQILALDIPTVAAQRSFIFLWCGSSEGLDMGRVCLRRWGFRRCEDICWIRTNAKNPGHTKNMEPKAVFQRTKEHCLMGIKGTVRRSTDGDFIHANVDIDLIITEEEDSGSLEKPTEIFHIIEHFCLGRRRLHLFGRDSTLRPGWLTIGPQLTNDNFNADVFASYFDNNSTTGCTDRIEALRPKSPPPKAGNKSFRGRPR